MDLAFQFGSSVPAWIALPFGLVMLLLGAEWLVDGAVRIARHLNVSTLAIGLTVVAFGTSAPELAVNVTAAVKGHADLAFGNVVGSNIANIGLVLGVGALIRPLAVHGRVVKGELPWMLLVSGAMIVLAVPIGDEADGYDRADGLLLLGCFAAWMWLWYRLARNESTDPYVEDLSAESSRTDRSGAAGAWGILLIGLGLLLLGGHLTESGAVKVARMLGLGQAVMGMTVVAIATSLPELVTVASAARRGHADLAVGNIIGSNMFNILLVLGATSTVAHVRIPGVGGWWDLGAMMTLSVLLLVIVIANRRAISRPAGVGLLLLYAAFMTWRVLREYRG